MSFKTLLIACTIAAGPAGAAPILYKCVLPHRPARSFMSKKINIVYNPANGRAQAVDGLIWHKHHRAMRVRVTADNDARTTFQWVVRDIPGRSNGVRTTLPGLRENMTILKGSLKIVIYQQPVGAKNSFAAEGTCTAQPWVPRKR